MDIKSLEADLQSTLSKARDLASQSDNRPFSDDEKSQMEDTLAKAREIRSQLDAAKEAQALKDSVKELGEGLSETKEKTPTMSNNHKSIGDWFVSSEIYKDLKSRGYHGVWSTGPMEYFAKATVSEDASPIIAEQRLGGVVDLRGEDFARPNIADLFAQGSTDSNMVRYTKETSATNAAAPTAEGADKPESSLVFDLVDEPVRKIATFLPVTDEMLEDAPQMASYINNRLAYFVQIAEDDQLLNGDGTAPNLSGLLDRDIQDDVDGDTLVEAIYNGITAVRVETDLEPDAMVVHPATYAALRLAKNGNDDYYGGGPFSSMLGDSIWGLRVVTSSRVQEDKVLVGAFRAGGQIFRRGGLTVEASNSHSDFFQKNLTAIRAEERLALAVYRPAAFALCSVGS